MPDPASIRTDLTEQQCAQIIGGLLGGIGISSLADLETLRRVVRRIAEEDFYWHFMENNRMKLQELATLAAKVETQDRDESG